MGTGAGLRFSLGDRRYAGGFCLAPDKEIGGFNMIDFSLRQRIVRPGSVLATALFLASGALAQNEPGAVYAMTNAAGGNSILIFDRAGNGTLSSAGSAATGGRSEE